MTLLGDLVDIDALEKDIADGYISRKRHPKYPYAILNYTHQAQYKNYWTNETTRCRGLIYDEYTTEIVARPFQKFFNYGQPGAAHIPLTAPVIVTDKLDGSMGIIYPTPDGNYAVATRGSFTSEQAIRATEMLKRYEFTPLPDGTYLVEIIYPENHIVVDYGKEEKLVLLGLVDIETGAITDPHDAVLFGEWNGPIVDTLDYQTLAQALLAEPRPNAEGMVVRQLGTDNMIKIKQEDYIRLHRIVFGLNERAVWEHLSTHDGDISGLLDTLPDEFHEWTKEKAYNLKRKFDITKHGAESTFFSMSEYINLGRKAFAEKAMQMGILRPYLFMLLDGKDISGAVWRSLKPKGPVPYRTDADNE